MTTGNEIALTMTMVITAIWTTLTGDTFFPSIVGATFAAYLRSRKMGQVDRIDLAVGSCASLFIGFIAGPYVASHLPEGQGVVGVGALIASFMGFDFFTRLHEQNWDMGAVLREIGSAFGKAFEKGKGDK